MRAILYATSAILLLGCSASEDREDKGAAKPACSLVGQRIREEHLRGIIFGEVGAKAEVAVCPSLRLPFAFVGDAPKVYKRLERLAAEREDVVGFNARGEGYIVTDGPSRYTLLLTSIDKIVEDPSVAERVNAATR
ncbi:hypothetical protein [Sphingomonas flavescens]|uniref:hypothetical protein n=1 Tax=Sphingomonas flavescens TaxID=3132797 RepID=UPI002804A7E6|nr:hypothetical protein [Sphingomonas limnosediminicola]